MADATVLSKPHAITLLQKLSTDDKFRKAYAANPRDTLLGLGVPENCLPKSMAPLTTLADKKAFEEGLTQVKADAADCHTCLIPPHVQMRKGK